MAGNFTSGEGSSMMTNLINGLVEKLEDKINQIIMEKSDVIVYDILQPQIEKQMETIFKSASMGMAASKMFTRELFPIYEKTLADFAKFNSFVKGVDANIKTKIIAFVKEYIESKTEAERNTAIEKFIGELKGISDGKVGKMTEMKGGDLKSFLGNADNKFEAVEGGTPAPNYLIGEPKSISDGIEKIVGGMKKTREELKATINESIENDAKGSEERRKLMSDNPNRRLGDKDDKKMSGGKSKRRKYRKRNKTYKKRR